ncbi:hypothetical protein LCH33_001826 [Pseudomonas amygdali]|uniref:DUF4145 domain-containing protein n=1 Tax=Pseudomonas amygdali pv. hibisci TaxID=251723 RepID=A0AB34U4X1_PSEA0|nr:hypothetical protein [Pseudomonas amygdali]KPX52740.1 Uncharacterized protein ALO67_03173 [Pseudomonas amygdali pv. hibisci]UBT78476.1 hypothetical protein LCH33_001826 [Pseudomonas amygdali]
MHYLNDSAAIFKSIADKMPSDGITDKADIRAFFDELLKLTKGLVIVDFLDTANWDVVESYELSDEGLLDLTWHDYREKEERPEEKEGREFFFPGDRYALALYVDSIKPIVGSNCAIFLINSYSKTEKEIRVLYSKDADEVYYEDGSFFEKRIVRHKSGVLEFIDFHCTPIYSLALIPKKAGISSYDSRFILYKFNCEQSLARLERVSIALHDPDMRDRDEISARVVTARRVFEFVLKVECCYAGLEVTKGYSGMLLGDLITVVKRGKDEKARAELGRIAELANNFAHDTGKPIGKETAFEVVDLITNYVRKLHAMIKK